MRERMHLIGGQFDISSKPGERYEDSGESSIAADRRLEALAWSSSPAIT